MLVWIQQTKDNHAMKESKFTGDPVRVQKQPIHTHQNGFHIWQ